MGLVYILFSYTDSSSPLKVASQGFISSKDLSKTFCTLSSRYLLFSKFLHFCSLVGFLSIQQLRFEFKHGFSLLLLLALMFFFFLLNLQDKTLKRVALRGFNHEVCLKILVVFFSCHFEGFLIFSCFGSHFIITVLFSWIARKYDVGLWVLGF